MIITALDIGGTSIKSASILANPNDKIAKYALNTFETSATNAICGKESILNNIYLSIEKIENDFLSDAIAVSCAGTIDWDNGVVTYATNALPNFTGLELKMLLQKRFNKNVVVINDAVAALVGEAYYYQPIKNTMMLTLGTGLGCALLKDTLLSNISVENPQLAHVCLHKDGRLCACGKCGCAEQYISATGLNKTLGELSEKAYKSELLEDFYCDFIKLLDIAQKSYCIDKVILGGGIIEQKQFWLEGLLNKIDKQLDISPAILGNKAGLFGAVYAGLNGKFKNQNFGGTV